MSTAAPALPRTSLLIPLGGIVALLLVRLATTRGESRRTKRLPRPSAGLVGLVVVALYLLGQRRGTLPAVGASVCMCIGLARYGGISEAGYSGPEFYDDGIPDAIARGALYVSACGGGTCNTEFEFLTGSSMSYVGAGKYPYAQYDMSDVGPQFIFDVTMQNHGGYDQGNIPEDQLTDYRPAGVDDATNATNAKLNEYLSCIEASDSDLEYLMDRLRELDRPVVVVFFGDHLPNVTTPYNDAYYPDEDPVPHAERAYQTTYFVWANYDVADESQDGERLDTSANYLGALLMGLHRGAPE